MVNTFVTIRKKVFTGKYIPDYRASARTLDLLRLRKQCVEAYQILNILEHLQKLSQLEGWDLFEPVLLNEDELPPEEQATRYLERVRWVKDIRKRYLALDYRYVEINGELFTVPKDEIPYRIDKSTGRWKIVDDGVVVWVKNSELSKLHINEDQYVTEDDYDLSEGKNLRSRTPILFPRNEIVLPDDTIYTLGFSQHAIIKMWIGYEDSLREYINAHTSEYCTHTTKSGKECSIDLPRYTLDHEYPHPWWITSYDGVILSHRASLLRKERERNEPEWYWAQPLFTSTPQEWLDSGYVWTGSFDDSFAHDIITRILSGDEVGVDEITAPIGADAQPRKSQLQLRKKYSYDGEYLLDQDGYVQIKFVKKV